MHRGLLRRNGFWLWLSLALCLVSAIGASVVQTGAGSIAVKDMRWETSSGRMMNALLFTPDGATTESPAPAVVVSHGWWNNREMQDANYVELARRGYVVVSIDMYGHGDSAPLPQGDIVTNGTGMYDAVKLVADLPYVDTDRIGVSGHSNGARAANFSIAADDAADEPLIASVFLVDNEAFYTDAENDGAYFNYYGDRDVGLVADQFDEFFFRSYDAEGVALTTPQEFVTTPNAQSFLNFGADPAASGEQRVADEYYSDAATDSLRVLHTPPQTHPWGTISSATVADQLEFFERTLGAPAPIEAGAQIWQLKEAFTTLGLIGFAVFLVAFARLLLGTRIFAGATSAAGAGSAGDAGSMAREGVAATLPVRATSRGGLAWFWGGLVISAVFSGVSYVLLSQATWLLPLVFNDSGETVATPVGAVFFIALWAAVNGVAALAIMTVSYLAFGRRTGLSLVGNGVIPGWRMLVSGVGLGAVVVATAYGIVFVLDYFFTTDFRLWVIAIKAFSVDKIGLALLYLPLFLVYFVANSIAINSFNRFTLLGREWVNTAVLALFNALAPLMLVVAQYVTFAVTGELIPGFGGIFSIWLFPVIVILAVTAVISRKIYRASGNPYIGGFINASVVALMSVSNSLVVS
ncbi:MAG: hypothetical protein RI885_1864 [Actinomycetota bacterium]